MSKNKERFLLPSLGEVEQAELLEWTVKEGEVFSAGQTIALVESDKATLEVPAPRAGRVLRCSAAAGDAVAEGSLLLEYEALDDAVETPKRREPVKEVPPAAEAAPPSRPQREVEPTSVTPVSAVVYAGPAVRRLARQIGVALDRVQGTGPRGRIRIEDLHAWVKRQLQQPETAWPKTSWQDPEKYGPTVQKPLERIRQVAAARLHASWVNIPHVTQQDEADVTAMEALRAKLKPEAGKRGVRLTPLAFLLQACVRALDALPLFRSSLMPDGRSLVQKEYFHIGMAVDTDRGLLVPVIKDAETRDIYAIAEEAARLSQLARDGRLSPADMAGGVFSISSLGHLGGTGFTPIVNPPEVAILGVSGMQRRLVPDEDGKPTVRILLPLSLSYDHRVVNGVQAVTFTRRISDFLFEPETLLQALRPSANLKAAAISAT